MSDLNFIGYIFSCALLACFISLFKGSVRVFLIFITNCAVFYWLNKNFLFLLLLQTFLIWLLCKSSKIKNSFLLALGLVVVLLPLLAIRIIEILPEETIKAGLTVIGISFYSLQIFSYLMDVRWERIAPQKSFVRLFCYFAFFGNIISGPIERSKKFFLQLEEKFSLNSTVFTHSLMYIFLGLVKKFVLADGLRLYAIQPLNKPIENPGLPIFIAILLSKFYLYYDLSGYSDMVVGVSKMMGIELTRNFNRPLFSMNIADFWKRWHISVSTWIRDYIFFPLLTTPLVVWGTSGLITLTFIIFGLWHGFQWTFVVYGLIQALFLIIWPRIEKVKLLNILPKPVRWFLFYFFILAIPNVLFFAPNTAHLIRVLYSVALPGIKDFSTYLNADRINLPTLFSILVIFEWLTYKYYLIDWPKWFLSRSYLTKHFVVLAAIIFFIAFAKINTRVTFVYWDF